MKGDLEIVFAGGRSFRIKGVEKETLKEIQGTLRNMVYSVDNYYASIISANFMKFDKLGDETYVTFFELIDTI